MADGPVQVVLNPDRFREARVPFRGGGAGKDFYEGNNNGFAAHKAALVGALRAILLSNRGERRINVTVQMRTDALAKSHRPFTSLFSAARASHVGTAEYGELVFAATPEKLSQIISIAESAEIEVDVRQDSQGRSVPWPTGPRSELSAIESIREWNPADERGFTLAGAEEWIAAEGSAKLSVHLFEVPRHKDLKSATEREIGSVAELVAESHLLFRLALPSADGTDELLTQPRSSHDVTEPSRFRESLARFEASSAVMRVRLDDRISPDADDSPNDGEVAILRPQDSLSNRPVVGIIDGGVSGYLETSVWTAGRTGLLAPEHRSVAQVDHGTKVASIVALGSSLNPGLLNPDEDCRIYDLDLFPDPAFRVDYYGSLGDYLGELRSSVERAKASTGARVFNLSYNLQRAPGGAPYSVVANGLDRIALDLDVIFVISAGNLAAAEERPEWPPAAREALAMLAADSTEDGLGAPAESIANVSVGAVNPTGLPRQIPGAPAAYSRRGVQVPSALKPDFAATGGATPAAGDRETGLRALTASTGLSVPVKGTSYAAPIVSRYLATLDASIAGDVSRELLLALAVHNASTPAVLRGRELAPVAQSFVGHGVLPSVADTLNGDPHRITIILSDTIKPGKRVEFPFTWPQSLTTAEGKCRGAVRLTLVAQPFLNSAHGWEMVRVNLDGAVKQADENETFRQRSQPTHEFFSGYRYATERTLASVLGKWYPIKSYGTTMPRGVGKSSNWRLDIDYLTRAAEGPPEAGVRFAAVLTIEDPDAQAPVFDEMRASLTNIGVSLNDLRTAVSIGVSV